MGSIIIIIFKKMGTLKLKITQIGSGRTQI